MTQTDDQLIDDGAEEEDWFGEGSAFNTQSELAAALKSVDVAPIPVTRPLLVRESVELDPIPDHENGGANGHVDHADSMFEVVDPRNPNGETAAPPPARPAPPAAQPVIPTWSVRIPGVQLLPPRMPGRSGWSIPNSVRILRQAEELVFRLREEAVITAFSAAARALRGEDS